MKSRVIIVLPDKATGTAYNRVTVCCADDDGLPYTANCKAILPVSDMMVCKYMELKLEQSIR